jgi:hypothetical protein
MPRRVRLEFSFFAAGLLTPPLVRMVFGLGERNRIGGRESFVERFIQDFVGRRLPFQFRLFGCFFFAFRDGLHGLTKNERCLKDNALAVERVALDARRLLAVRGS